MSALNRRMARRKGLKTHVLKIQEDIKVCLAESHLDQVKNLGLKNSFLEKVEKLSDVNEQVLTGLEPANNEADVVESMTFLDPIHELLAEITLKTESIKLNSLTTRSTKGSSENCIILLYTAFPKGANNYLYPFSSFPPSCLPLFAVIGNIYHFVHSTEPCVCKQRPRNKGRFIWRQFE